MATTSKANIIKSPVAAPTPTINLNPLKSLNTNPGDTFVKGIKNTTTAPVVSKAPTKTPVQKTPSTDQSVGGNFDATDVKKFKDLLSKGIEPERAKSLIYKAKEIADQGYQPVPMASPLFPYKEEDMSSPLGFIKTIAKPIGNLPTSAWNLAAGTVNMGADIGAGVLSDIKNESTKGTTESVGRAVKGMIVDPIQKTIEDYQNQGAIGGTSALIGRANKFMTEEPVMAMGLAKGIKEAPGEVRSLYKGIKNAPNIIKGGLETARNTYKGISGEKSATFQGGEPISSQGFGNEGYQAPKPIIDQTGNLGAAVDKFRNPNTPETTNGKPLSNKAAEQLLSSQWKLDRKTKSAISNSIGGTGEQFALENNLVGEDAAKTADNAYNFKLQKMQEKFDITKTLGDTANNDTYKDIAKALYNHISEGILSTSPTLKEQGVKSIDELTPEQAHRIQEENPDFKILQATHDFINQDRVTYAQLDALKSIYDASNPHKLTYDFTGRAIDTAADRSAKSKRNIVQTDIEKAGAAQGIDIGKINKEIQAADALEKGLTKADERMANHNIIGLLDTQVAALAGIISGGPGALGSILFKKGLVDNQGVRSWFAKKLYNKQGYEDTSLNPGDGNPPQSRTSRLADNLSNPGANTDIVPEVPGAPKQLMPPRVPEGAAYPDQAKINDLNLIKDSKADIATPEKTAARLDITPEMLKEILAGEQPKLTEELTKQSQEFINKQDRPDRGLTPITDTLQKRFDEFGKKHDEINNKSNKQQEIINALESSKAGYRNFIENQDGPGHTVHGVSSTFPKWLPEKSRRAAIVNEVVKNLVAGTYPKSKSIPLIEAFDIANERGGFGIEKPTEVAKPTAIKSKSTIEKTPSVNKTELIKPEVKTPEQIAEFAKKKAEAEKMAQLDKSKSEPKPEIVSKTTETPTKSEIIKPKRNLKKGGFIDVGAYANAIEGGAKLIKKGVEKGVDILKPKANQADLLIKKGFKMIEESEKWKKVMQEELNKGLDENNISKYREANKKYRTLLNEGYRLRDQGADLKRDLRPDGTVGDLVVVHNLSADKLKKIKALGALPGPSLAVTNKAIHFSDFGDVTLIGDRKLIESNKATTYSNDVYSPRVPEPSFVQRPNKYIQEEVDKMTEQLKSYGVNGWQVVGDLDNGPNSSLALHIKFAKDNGIKFDLKKKPVVEIPDDGKLIWLGKLEKKTLDKYAPSKIADGIDGLKQQMNGIVHKIYKEHFPDYALKDMDLSYNEADRLARYFISKDRPPITDNWGTVSQIKLKIAEKGLEGKYQEFVDNLKHEFYDKKLFSHWAYGGQKSFKPYSLENILDQMFKKGAKGTESGIFSGNLSQTLGKSSKKLNLSEIRQQKFGQSPELDSKWEDLKSEWNEYATWNSGQAISDNFSLTKSNEAIKRGLENDGVKHLSIDEIQRMKEIIREAQKLPKTYIETKIERGVNLNEFKAVLAPQEQVLALKQILKGTGLEDKIVAYKKGENRNTKLDEVNKKYGNIFFSQGGLLIPAAVLLNQLLGKKEDKKS